MAKTLTGRKRPECAGGNAFNAKVVVCINTGERYACMREAADILKINYGGVLRSCNLHCTVGDGLVFMSGEEYDMCTDEMIRVILQEANYKKIHKNKTTHVVCLNTREEFRSIYEAAARYNIRTPGTIRDVCNKVQVTAGVDHMGTPLIWMQADEYYNGYSCMSDEEVATYMQKMLNVPLHRYKVVCVETQKEYPSILAASKDAEITNTGLKYHLSKHGFYYNKNQNATYEYIK